MSFALKLGASLLALGASMVGQPDAAPSARTWQLQNVPKPGQFYTTDWFKGEPCQWAHAYNGGTIIARTKELIEGGYIDDYGRLTGGPAGTTSFKGRGGGLAGIIRDYGSYYNGRTLVFEVAEGVLGAANSLNFSGWGAGNTITLNRVLDNSGQTGDGATTTFTTSATTGNAAGTSAAQLRVYVDGVRQVAGTDYTVADNGSDLDVIFATAPANAAALRFMSIRLELLLNDISQASSSSAHAALSIGDVSAIAGLGCSFFDKADEADVYDAPNNPWKQIHPGIRTYQDHADCLRTLDLQNRISINDATSFSEFGQPDSFGWGGSDGIRAGADTVDQTHEIYQLHVKSGVSFNVIASYCEQHEQTLWYHMPGWMLSPIRKSMYIDHTGTGASLGWFSDIWINVSSVQIETQTDKGSVTLDLAKKRFEYNPYDDNGRGNDHRLWNLSTQTGDGTTTDFVLTGQANDDTIAIWFGTKSGNPDATEGVDYTLTHGSPTASDVTVSFTTAPADGQLISFGFENRTEYVTFSAEDPHDSNARRSFVVPLSVSPRGTGTKIIYVWPSAGQMWSATDATSTPAADNKAWFTAAHRWQKEAYFVVQELINSGYSQSREIILEVSNEVWNTATEFEPDTSLINGIGSNAYGQTSKSGLGIITGFIRKYVEEEMVNQSVSYDITWAAAVQTADSDSSQQRYNGHEYFWENIEGLTAPQATAKNAKFQCFGTMYYSNGFRNKASDNITGLSDPDHSTQVLAWLTTSYATLETNFFAWHNSATDYDYNVQNILNSVAAHNANAVAHGSIFRGFYEGGSHETQISSTLQADNDFQTWFDASWNGEFGAQMWRDVSDALIALYPNIMLSHYGSTQEIVMSNPWHTGPWELGDNALFACMRDEYGTGYTI